MEQSQILTAEEMSICENLRSRYPDVRSWCYLINGHKEHGFTSPTAAMIAAKEKRVKEHCSGHIQLLPLRYCYR